AATSSEDFFFSLTDMRSPKPLPPRREFDVLPLLAPEMLSRAAATLPRLRYRRATPIQTQLGSFRVRRRIIVPAGRKYPRSLKPWGYALEIPAAPPRARRRPELAALPAAKAACRPLRSAPVLSTTMACRVLEFARAWQSFLETLAIPAPRSCPG